MAGYKGKGRQGGINLVAVWSDKNMSKGLNGHAPKQYVDIQLDARDDLAVGQTNLHLSNSGQRISATDSGYTTPYTLPQFEQMVAAAGDNVDRGPDGMNRATFKAAVIPRQLGGEDSSLIVDSRTLQGSDFEIHDKIMEAQAASVSAAKSAQAPQPRSYGTPRVVAAGEPRVAPGARTVVMNADHKASIEAMDAKADAGLENSGDGLDR